MSQLCCHCRLLVAVHQAAIARSTSAQRIAALSIGGAFITAKSAVGFFTEVRLASKGVGRHAVILVDAVTVVAVGPIGKLARVIARRTLKPPAVEIDDVPGLA